MLTPADVTTAMSAIISQMAEGEITPEEAAVAASVIETKRKALETEELDRRVFRHRAATSRKKIAMTRLRSRVSAVEEKVVGSCPNNAIKLYFMKGYPTDGAEDLLRANGQPVLFRIQSWYSSRGGRTHVVSPLVDMTRQLRPGYVICKPPPGAFMRKQ